MELYNFYRNLNFDFSQMLHPWRILFIIRLRLNVAFTHQNRSNRDRETKENAEAQEMKQSGRNDRKRTATTKNKHNLKWGRIGESRYILLIRIM